jgi:hypothetical protein
MVSGEDGGRSIISANRNCSGIPRWRIIENNGSPELSGSLEARPIR